jgi:hypothetical protein
MSVHRSPIADLEHPFALLGFPIAIKLIDKDKDKDKDIGKGKMQRDVPDWRSANGER